MSNNKYDALQNRFDSSRIKVSVYCDNAGLWEVPEGKELTYNRDTDTHYVDGEPWCTEEYLAHHDDAQNWSVEKVAHHSPPVIVIPATSWPMSSVISPSSVSAPTVSLAQFTIVMFEAMCSASSRLSASMVAYISTVVVQCTLYLGITHLSAG